MTSPAGTRRASSGTDVVFAGYLVLQAVGGLVLWALLAWSEPVRSALELVESEPAVVDAFVFADLTIGVGGSLAAAWALATHRRSAVPLTAFVAGGIVYPTIVLVGWVAFTTEGNGMLAVMVAPSVLSSWVAWQTWRASRRADDPAWSASA